MVKLDRLINILGRYGTHLYGCTSTRDRELHSVAVHDPVRPHASLGDVFLAVGVANLEEGVTLAAEARAILAVVRTTETMSRALVDALHSTDSALLLVDPSVSWSQIASVVYGLVLEGRETESGRGPSDLFALADTIAATLSAPVTIEDQLSRVMAYSSAHDDTDPARLSTILGRRTPDHVRAFFDQREVFTHFARSDTPIYVPPSLDHGLRGRTAAAVRAGRELLGSVWVSAEEPLDEVRAQVLKDGAHTVGLHLLRSRVSADLERQVESELVIQLIQGTANAEAVAHKLGIPSHNLRVIAFQADTDAERNAGILLAFERATTGFGWSRIGRSTLFGNIVYTVIPAGDDPGPALRWIESLAAELPSHINVVAGIGGTADARDLPASRQEADESMALHAGAGAATPVCYDDSWDRILIQRLKAVAANGRIPGRGPVARLAEYDAQHATQHIPTLKAWLAAQGDLNATAETLKVHPNTVRYRIRKMRQITDLDMDDPGKRIAMLIALSIRSE
ncbi:helix-turn-helix domain-containing protein [Nocardia sp. NPDC049707]|uniref:PucR family transcriptional regulator n=1 Tax=Nocardia sp. NPDC049707 TaxID=3154735 RepID=UPI00341C1147